MTLAAPATELLPVPAHGRRFSATWTVRLADTDARGRMRLDAIARHLQDVATDDAADCRLDPAYGWVVRRTLIVTTRPAVLAERIRLTTFCTGTGRAWAERRTTIVGEGGAVIDAVSLWVQVDVATGRPAALGEQFFEHYGEAAAGRKVSTRLALAGPPPAGATRPWTVRAVDLDVFGHVNNASHWPILEEVLARSSAPRTGVAEMEYLLAVDDGTAADLCITGDAHHEVGAWLVAGGRVHTAARRRASA